MTTIPSLQTISDCSLGNGNIDPSLVIKAVSSIQQTCSALFSKIISEKGLGWLIGRESIRTFECLSKEAIEGDISIKKSDDKVQAKEERYAVGMVVNLKDIDESTPLGLLVSQLSKRVAQLGFPCENLDLRFEQGYLKSLTPSWHFDPKPSFWNRGASENSIITSYSNKANWGTRILNPKNNTEMNRDKIEELSEPAKPGYLYNGQCVFHRSPLEKDVGEIAQSDYRLFIRFFKWPEKDKVDS